MKKKSRKKAKRSPLKRVEDFLITQAVLAGITIFRKLMDGLEQEPELPPMEKKIDNIQDIEHEIVSSTKK